MNIKNEPVKRLIIGSGRLAQHLCHWWNIKKIPYTQWSRVNDQNKTLLNNSIKNADYVYLAISDRSIEPFYQEVLKSEAIKKSQKFIHFSGSLSIDGLIGAHPLMTFGPNLYNEEQYDQICYVLEVDKTKDKFSHHTDLEFNHLFPNHPNHVAFVGSDQKSLYHAMIVLLGNLTPLMLKELINPLSSMGIKLTDLKPYLQMSLDNAIDNPKTAATGPWVRNDLNTIESHLSALKNTPYLDFYLSSLKTFGHKINPPEKREHIHV